MAVVIVIKGWEEYQHYKDRDPPWVKLHRKMLTSVTWMHGTNLTRIIQIASILLAPRYKNQIPCDPETLRRAGGIDGTDREILDGIAYLVEHDFLDIQEVAETAKRDAFNLLAKCSSEKEAEAEEEADPDCSAAAPPCERSASTALAVSRGTRIKREEPDWLPAFKAIYPKRSGDPNWRGAIRAGNARLQEGYTVEQFMDGARRYAAYIAATGAESTEYVQQASRFLGPGKPFMGDWTPPASKAQRAQDSNVNAGLTWLANSGAGA